MEDCWLELDLYQEAMDDAEALAEAILAMSEEDDEAAD